MSKRVYKPWTPSDRTLLINKVKELGMNKGATVVAEILDREPRAVEAMYRALERKERIQKRINGFKEKLPKVRKRNHTVSGSDIITSLQGQEVHIPIQSMTVDVKRKKLIIKL